MITYVDASVLLRVALAQPNVLPEWPGIRRGVASALVMTESLRTLDRLRLRANLSDAEVAERRGVGRPGAWPAGRGEPAPMSRCAAPPTGQAITRAARAS